MKGKDDLNIPWIYLRQVNHNNAIVAKDVVVVRDSLTHIPWPIYIFS